MDWGRVKFFLGEVARSFSRNSLMQLTAIGTVAVTLMLLGAFLFIRTTLADLGNGMLQQIEISVYVNQNATPHEIAALRASFRADPRIASVAFIPKSEGLKELRARTHGVIDTSLLTENPLPDKFRVRVHDPALVPAVAADLRRLTGVGNVVYGQQVVQRLLRLGEVLRRVGMALIALFLVVAGIIISNTTRIAVYARRREIGIMQLVGATNMYIRMPFICEGLVVGMLGSAAAVVLLVAARETLWPRMLEALPFVQFNVAFVDVPSLILQLFLVGGIIGASAAWFAVGRHLQT
ncbi:MAG: permease-like cell division protein FtsX [Candidatus Tyrphobacter sp.]